MFKNIIRVRIGGWWLQAGVWVKWRVPFFKYQSSYVSVREFSLRVLWFEVCLSELPF
jgi:hypothetical protein